MPLRIHDVTLTLKFLQVLVFLYQKEIKNSGTEKYSKGY